MSPLLLQNVNNNVNVNVQSPGKNNNKKDESDLIMMKQSGIDGQRELVAIIEKFLIFVGCDELINIKAFVKDKFFKNIASIQLKKDFWWCIDK